MYVLPMRMRLRFCSTIKENTDVKTKTIHHIDCSGLHHPALLTPQERNLRIRTALSKLPPSSRFLVPELLSPVVTVSLVLKARAKRLVPVWWDSVSREYKLFPRS